MPLLVYCARRNRKCYAPVVQSTMRGCVLLQRGEHAAACAALEEAAAGAVALGMPFFELRARVSGLHVSVLGGRLASLRSVRTPGGYNTTS